MGDGRQVNIKLEGGFTQTLVCHPDTEYFASLSIYSAEWEGSILGSISKAIA
jgi:hypothetical protein